MELQTFPTMTDRQIRVIEKMLGGQQYYTNGKAPRTTKQEIAELAALGFAIVPKHPKAAIQSVFHIHSRDRHESSRLLEQLGYQRTRSETRCRFCRSHRCYTRIVSRDEVFDELACRSHIGDLERLADRVRPGMVKSHIMSSDPLVRGQNVGWGDLETLQND